jgi:hypothetical protein
MEITAKVSKPVQAPATKGGTWSYMELMKINGPYIHQSYNSEDMTNTIHLENLKFTLPTDIISGSLRYCGKVFGAQPKKKIESPVRMTGKTLVGEGGGGGGGEEEEEEEEDEDDDDNNNNNNDETWSMDVGFDVQEFECRKELDERERHEEKKCVSIFEEKFYSMDVLKGLIEN